MRTEPVDYSPAAEHPIIPKLAILTLDYPAFELFDFNSPPRSAPSSSPIQDGRLHCHSPHRPSLPLRSMSHRHQLPNPLREETPRRPFYEPASTIRCFCRFSISSRRHIVP